MENVVNGELTPAARFKINPTLDLGKLHKEFHDQRRVRVRNFLNYEAADALYYYLDKKVMWRTFVVANDELMGTPPRSYPTTAEEDREILRIAHSAVKSGFSAVYDATRLFLDDVYDGTDPGLHESDTVLASCDAFLASEPFLAFARTVVGCAEIRHVATQATRLRVGHFVAVHSSTCSAEKATKRCATFFLNLTPEWRPERGGLTEFRQKNGDVIEAYLPAFNVLDILSFPKTWWVSTVSPIAEDPIYTLQGRLYRE